jgi:hypothetical protein
VRPASALGPPISKDPDGLITILVSLNKSAGHTFLIIYSVRVEAICSLVTLGSCWVEMRILYMLMGLMLLPSFLYSMITYDLQSGLNHGIYLECLALASSSQILFAR